MTMTAPFISRELSFPRKDRCDFGEARIGLGRYDHLAMPMPYRAPEITLEVPWRSLVDRYVGLTIAPQLWDEDGISEIALTRLVADLII